MKYIATSDGNEYPIEIVDELHVNVHDRIHEVDFLSLNELSVFSLIVDGKSHEAFVHQDEDGWQVLLNGRLYSVQVEEEWEKRLRSAGSGAVADTGEYHLKSPMPGMIVSVPVEEGKTVEKDQVLLILESMKMQNELKSPRAGKIGRIKIKPGESVEQRQDLLSVI